MIGKRRMVLVGRDLETRALRFATFAPTAHIDGIAFRAYGPMGITSLRKLMERASAEAEKIGHHPDAFAILGIGRIGLIALVPAESPEGEEDRIRALRALGVAE